MLLLKPNLQAIIQAGAHDAAQLLPPHYSCRPDMVNLKPTDLVACGDGGRLAGTVNIGNVVPGSMSPGIWYYYPTITALAVVTFMLGISAMFFGAWIPFSTIFDAWQIDNGTMGSIWFALKMTALGWMLFNLVPAAGVAAQFYYWWLVLSEQEPSRDFWRLWCIAGAIIITLCVLIPGVGPLGCAVTSLLSIIGFRLYVGLVEKANEDILVDVTNDTRTSSIAKGLESQEEARRKQHLKSAEDKTRLIKIGTADGTLRRDGDLMTRDKGAAFCISVKDLREQNIRVVGRSRGGKTSSLLRPLVAQLVAATYNHETKRGEWGLVAYDGAKTFPFDLRKQLHYVLTPENSSLNPLNGVSVEVAADTMLKVCAVDKNEWTAKAEVTWRHCLWMVKTIADIRKPDGTKAFPNIHWSLRSASSWYKLKGLREEVMTEVFDHYSEHFSAPHLVESWVYWGQVVPKTHPEGWSSITGILDAWTDPMVSHSKLGSWVGEESDIDVVDFVCRQRGRIGPVAPDDVYGVGGRIAIMLIRAGIHAHISARPMLYPNGWEQAGENPVLEIIDEYHGIATPADGKFAATCLGNGMTMVLSYQTDSQLEKPTAMGRESADELLANCAGLFVFNTKFETIERACKDMGYRHRWFADDKNVQHAPLLQLAKAELSNGLRDKSRGRMANVAAGVVGMAARRRRMMSMSHHQNLQDMEASNPMRAAATLRGYTELTTTCKPEEAKAYLEVPFKVMAHVLVASAPNREFIDVVPDYLPETSAADEDSAVEEVEHKPPQLLKVPVRERVTQPV